MTARRLAAVLGAALVATGAALLPIARSHAAVGSTAISFTHEITVDPQRLGSEPDLAVSPYADGAIYTSSIWGFSNTQSFLYKSADGGAQYRLIRVLPTGDQRPTASQGGGDTEIQVGSPDKAGDPPAVYFADLNNLSTIDCAYSYDGGNTFTLSGPVAAGAACNAAAGNTPGADRQWYAVYKQAGKADTVYMFYNDADLGKFSLLTSTDAGQTYTVVNTAIGTNTFRPGPIQVDQTTGDIYTFVSTLDSSSHYGVAVDVSTNGGATFTQHDILPAAQDTAQSTSTDFVSGAVDSAGNVYAVWARAAVDTAHPTVTFYSYSTDHGVTWAAPIAVTGPGSAATGVTAAEFPWITAGDPGRVDIAFYGSTSALPYDPGSASVPWDVYMAQATTYTDLSVVKASEHPTHIAPICNAGLGCTGTGDRNLGDFFEIQHDAAGRAVINYCDDNNSAIATVSGGCVTSSLKQASGPSVFSATPTVSDPGSSQLLQSLDVRSAITDASGDATLGGAAVPAADITGVSVAPKDAATMEVTINVADLSSPTSAIVNSAAGGAHTSATWMVSWHTATDVYFAACSIDQSGTPAFFAGRPENVPNAGAPKALLYSQGQNTTAISAGSSLDSAHNRIVLDVPYSTVGTPAPTDTLFSVQGYTLDGVAGVQGVTSPLQDQIDATAPIDYAVTPTVGVPEAPWSALLIAVGAVLAGSAALRRRSRAL